MTQERWGFAIVRGRSMQPTLRDGDRLIVRHGRLPRRGQLALVNFEGTVVVKRLDIHDDDGWWFSRDNPTEGVDSWSRGMASVTSEVLGTVIARTWPRPRRL